MNNKSKKGFTLIELMIVIAIIGILASIALPSYKSYIARSQAAESIVLLDNAQKAAEDIATISGAFPPVSATAATASTALNGATTDGTYGQVTIATSVGDSGNITYTFGAGGKVVNANLDTQTVSYNRAPLTGTWTCTSSAGLITKYKPAGCP